LRFALTRLGIVRARLFANFRKWEIVDTHSDQNSTDGFAATVKQVFSFGKKRVGAAAKPKALSVPSN
jgi:hypothetical protein